MNFQTQPIHNQNQQQQQHTPQVQATPEPPKQKQPLPEEFVYMQTVFNELRQQCVNAASNPVSGLVIIMEEYGMTLTFIFFI